MHLNNLGEPSVICSNDVCHTVRSVVSATQTLSNTICIFLLKDLVTCSLFNVMKWHLNRLS